MKNLVNYLSESVFDIDLGKTSNGLSAKEDANKFISKISPLDDPWKHYDFRNSTIYPENSKFYSSRALIVGYIDGDIHIYNPYVYGDDALFPFEEYSKMSFKWAGDLTVHIECIEKGVKLSDLHLGSDVNLVLSIGAMKLTRITSRKLSDLLDKFIDTPQVSNIILVLNESGNLLLDDVDFLNSQKLGNFKSVIYNASPKSPVDTQEGLLTIQDCPVENLFISGPAILDSHTKEEFEKVYDHTFDRWKDIYTVLRIKGKNPDLQDTIKTYLTDIAKNNPNTDIYLSYHRINASQRKLDEVVKISYKGRKLNYTYLNSVEV